MPCVSNPPHWLQVRGGDVVIAVVEKNGLVAGDLSGLPMLDIGERMLRPLAS